MLQLSNSAAAALQEARAAQNLPDTVGVRVFAEPTDSGQLALGLGFSEEPAEGDEVSEQSGTRLYIAQEVAEPLSDSLIDVEPSAEGPQLVIKPQDAPE